MEDYSQRRDPGGSDHFGDPRLLSTEETIVVTLDETARDAAKTFSNFLPIAKNQITKKPIFLNENRDSHMLALGATRTGKSTLLINMATNDIRAGHSVVFIDPHGLDCHRLLSAIPDHLIEKVIYCEVPKANFTWNPLSVPKGHEATSAGNYLRALKDNWIDSWGERLGWTLFMGIFLLMEQGGHIGQLRPLYFRKALLNRYRPLLKDKMLREFWNEEYETYRKADLDSWKMPIMNRIGQFLSIPAIRTIMQDLSPTLDVAYAIDNGYSIVLNLNKGQLTDDTANLFASLFVSDITTALKRRPIEKPGYIPKRCRLYIDEFHNVSTENIPRTLSEIAKYGGDIVLGSQYMAQLKPSVISAILGNIGTLLAFRIGPEDAELIAKYFIKNDGQPIRSGALTDQINHHAWLRHHVTLPIDGTDFPALISEPIVTTPPFTSERDNHDIVIRRSERRFSRKRS